MVIRMAIPRFNRWFVKRTIIGLLILFAGYVISVGAVPAIFRHTGDSGRLQWLSRCPGAMTLLEVYEWPARQVAGVPVLRQMFEVSGAVWWGLLNPPDTTA